jgi:hypothetical protein
VGLFGGKSGFVQAQRPAPGDIASELARLLRIGASLAALEKSPAILGLAVVRASAASDSPADLASAALGLLLQGPDRR